MSYPHMLGLGFHRYLLFFSKAKYKTRDTSNVAQTDNTNFAMTIKYTTGILESTMCVRMLQTVFVGGEASLKSELVQELGDQKPHLSLTPASGGLQILSAIDKKNGEANDDCKPILTSRNQMPLTR
jgi:hypothetical protein